MKKLIIISFILFFPMILFAQSGGDSFVGTLIETIFIMAIAVGMFLILRSLVLWYWKVYDIINNQEKQIYEQQQTNDLLKKQIEILNKLLPPKDEKP